MLPTWRGQTEQGMALAAVGYARATDRRQVMAATSSVGPGALNMVTAAGLAHANRLPVLLLPGDTFTGRAPDPVLQQVEHFGDPTTSVNDAFRAVSRYFDRIVRPEQLLVDAAAGRARADRPGRHRAGGARAPAGRPGRRSTTSRWRCSPSGCTGCPGRGRTRRRSPRRWRCCARRSGRCWWWAGESATPGPGAPSSGWPSAHGIPVVETPAGRTAVAHDHPLHAGPLGIIGSTSANTLAAEADVVVAVGTRLQDFTTASWTVFSPSVRIVTVNAARFDAVKHGAHAVVGDALAVVEELAAGAGRVVGRRGVERAGRRRARALGRARRRAAQGCRAGRVADLRAGGRRRQRRQRPGRLRARRRPAASPARCTAGGGPRDAASPARRPAPRWTWSTASPAWGTRSPARGERRWPGPRPTPTGW